ncbi:MAG: 6-carboxytetrahydropterin synthase [Phycisphaerae bacterium]
MYRITVNASFRADHQLNISGTVEPMHEHNWQVEAAIGGENLDENGLLFDFNRLKKMLDGAVSGFKDRKLEDCPVLRGKNTSAENVAEYIYRTLKPQLPADLRLLYVEVQEAIGCKARYES